MEKIVLATGDVAFGGNLKTTLESAGYQVTFVSDGLEAIKAITDTMPHLVLLDVTLSNSTGYDVLAQKMNEPLLARIPVFLISTQATPINMRLVPQGSVAKFIVSLHADPKDILNSVNAQLGHKAEVPAVPVVAPGDQKTILWVEDDKLIGNILGKKLSTSGFNLIHCKTGEEAFKNLESVVPDAILIDLLLPGMSGFDILQKIRADARFEKVPVMILSNLSKPSDIEKARTLGAQKFLIKATASLDQIVAEVRNLKK